MTDQERRDKAKNGYATGRHYEWCSRQVNPHDAHLIEVGAAVIGLLGNAVNGGSEREIAEGMFLAMQLEHRTLQQGTFRVLCRFIELYADQDKARGTDARNIASYELAKKLAEITSTSGLPLI